MNKRQYELLKRKRDRIVNTFASNPNVKQRTTTKVVKMVILDAPYLINGRFWDIKAKSLGAGVYELSLKDVQ